MRISRWSIAILMFAGIFINYLDRVNISYTILLMSAELKLTALQQGVILSAFSWGYVLFMLPGGFLVDKLGPRIMNALSSATWSIFTALTAFGTGFFTLLFPRFMLGISEAPIFPGNAKVVFSNYQPNERGRATALFDAGSYAAVAIAAPFIIFIMLKFGWRMSFIVCSILGIVWSLVWYYSYREKKETTSYDSKTQTSLLTRKTILMLLGNPKILAISFGFFCYNYLKSFFLTWFPTYLLHERHFSFLGIGIVSFIPPFCAIWAELFAGYFTDLLIMRGASISLARKLPLCLGFLLSSSVAFASIISNQIVVVSLFSISYAGLIAASPSIWAIPGDIAPNKNVLGTIGGIQNTFSNIAGIIAPIITGLLFAVTGSFEIPLLVSGILILLGIFAYLFGAGQLKPIQSSIALDTSISRT
jgi:MFS transporter, ACS family, D-galactonate transporter